MKKILATISSFALPVVAFAQNTSPTAFGIIQTIRNIFSWLIPLAITLGVFYFIWGVIQYIGGSSEEAKSEGRNRMIWGIIGLFVVVSIWGLVGIIGNTFGVQQGGGPDNIPTVI